MTPQQITAMKSNGLFTKSAHSPSPVELKLKAALALSDLVGIKECLVTPQAAKDLLSMNTSNRAVREQRVVRYANDMLSGKWKRGTFELIKVSKDGRIIDGQHRIMAVVKCNVSVYLQFIFNVDDSVFDVLDTGATRNASDIFKIEGVKNEAIIPSIITTYYTLMSGMMVSRSEGRLAQARLSNHEILAEYQKNPEYWQDVARRTHSWYSSFKTVVTPSLIGGLYSYLMQRNEDGANRFMTQLTTGMGLESNMIGLLRNKLIEDKLAKYKMTQREKIALIIKTWNYYREGRSVKVIKFNRDQEDFPVAL